MTLTHVDPAGRAVMVDVGRKPVTARHAVAIGRVIMSAEALAEVESAAARKGDVLTVAEVAGIMAAKRTGELIPLCHTLPLDKVEVQVVPRPEWPGVEVTATARATARTGVEMEALVAVSVTCLTVFDMVKAVDRGARIEGIRVLEKAGGASGTWHAPAIADDSQVGV
ncbi:MAG TPA: cyclic pyranopterin monophosphate synthase MoaC [Gemmatimonadales bacterium]|nr:cyclic pyranopterin monophosphate synthase MoaC [Gemmatimonadales bacterium]